MNRSEIAELKKLYKPDRCNINRIAYAYIDHEKNILGKQIVPYLQLPEDDTFKFLDIYSKALSGKIGKNLIEMEFTTSEARKSGSPYSLLMELKDSELKDTAVFDRFVDLIIENYTYAENYAIFVAYSVYDVPQKATDGTTLEDSLETYSCITCSICPVKTEKPGLYFNGGKGQFISKETRFSVEAPLNGFLFPAFNDRTEDIHALMFYTKKPEEMHKELLSWIIGTDAPLSATEQKDVFDQVFNAIAGERADLSAVKEVHEDINKMIEASKKSREKPVVTKDALKAIFERSALGDHAAIEKAFEAIDTDGEPELLATNIIDSKSFAIKSPDVQIKVKGDRTDIIRTEMINGEKCLVIRADNAEVNGVAVR